MAELQWSSFKENKDGDDKGFGLVYLKKQKSCERSDIFVSP